MQEERELYPGDQQRKIDDLWNTVESKSKVSLISSLQATLNSSSLRSPNLEDIDLLSEFSERSKATPEKDGEKKGNEYYNCNSYNSNSVFQKRGVFSIK